MVCNIQAFVDPAGRVRELPNYIGRSWQTTRPIITLLRQGACWKYGEPVSMGTVLMFSGWSGLDRTEPLASFVSADMPGVIVFLPPSKLKEWCREVVDAELVEVSEVVKVRVADSCGEGE